MKKPIVALIVVLVICTLAVGYTAFSMTRSAGQSKEKDKEFIAANSFVVETGDVTVEVIETGPLAAKEAVEVKSRVQGRVKQLLVDEGDIVQQGQLVAVIDPQETQLQVEQNEAQVRGAVSQVERIDIEIKQKRVTAQTALARAQSRLRQLETELAQQPVLTSTAIRTAESSLASNKQSLDLLTRVTQPNTKVQVQSALDEAKANLENSKIELTRRTALLEKGYISKRDFEQAELNVKLAETRVDTAKERLDNLAGEQRLEIAQAQSRVQQAEQELRRAKANGMQDSLKKEEYKQAVQNVRDAQAALRDVDSLQASRRQQVAGVDQLQSVLSDARRLLGETEIRAPVSGVVTKRLVQLGELVASLSSFSSGTPLFRVEDRQTMKVTLNVNEIDVAKLKFGTVASIRVDAFPDRKYSGLVTKIAPASNEAAAGAVGNDPVVKYQVEVTLDNSDKLLKSGMSAQCTMKVVNVLNVLRVRREYINTLPDGSAEVLVVPDVDKKDKPEPLKPGEMPTPNKGKKPITEKRKVKVGASSGAYSEILEGLKKGEMIWKPEFTGPGRKTFFADGDEAQRAEEKKKQEEELKKKNEETAPAPKDGP